MKPTKNIRLIASLAVCLTAALVATGTAHAQTGDNYTFTGGNDGGAWSDAANWEGGYAPDSTNDADGLANIYLAAGAGTSSVDQTYYIASLTQEATAADTLTSSGGNLLANGTTVTNLSVSNLSSTALTISGSAIDSYTGSQLTFSSGGFYVTGSVSAGYAVNVNLGATVNTSSTGSVNSLYNSVISSGSLGGSGTVSAFSGGGSVENLGGSTLVVGDPTVNKGVGVLTGKSYGDQFQGFILGAGSTADFAFNGNAHSEVETDNMLKLQPGVTFDISSVGGVTAPGTYELVAFTGAAVDPSADVLELPTGWTGTLGSSDNELYLDLTSTGANVPEPQTWALLGFGLVTVAFLARRKMARQS